jgi:hypothetical protein
VIMRTRNEASASLIDNNKSFNLYVMEVHHESYC